MNKIVKLSVIRENNTTSCPFGLNINSACKTAGHLVEDMTNVSALVDEPEDVISRVTEQNLKILNDRGPQGRCLYSSRLFKENPNVVDCNFGDSAAGYLDPMIANIPEFENQTLSGQNRYTLYTLPFGYVSDSNGDLNTNLYYSNYITVAYNKKCNIKIANINKRLNILYKIYNKNIIS